MASAQPVASASALIVGRVRQFFRAEPAPAIVAIGELAPVHTTLRRLWQAYRLRWKRRRLLVRAIAKRRQLTALCNRTAQIAPQAILATVTLRNERQRLPHFLDHHRNIGVDHFLIVDNASTDGSRDYLLAQPDVSLWGTGDSYKLSRFGLDWLTWLQLRYAHGHWCLTLDVDELLVYPYWATRNLKALTEWLDGGGVRSFGALMLDMYPKGPIGAQPYVPGQNPVDLLGWFDGGNYSVQVQTRMRNLWIQGGARARHFFAAEPHRAPTLNKVPLVKWNRRYVYVNSTHAILPAALNRVFDELGGEKASGILLHTKFLPEIIGKSREEQGRRQHFANSDLYQAYHAQLTEGPDLWSERSHFYTGWRQLEAMGLMSRGGWL